MSNEHKLIYLLTRLELNISAQQQVKEIINNSLDWHSILKISIHHEILSFLYYNITKLNLQTALPLKILSTMKDYYYYNLFKNLRIEKEIMLIIDLIGQKNITIIPLKGFSLIQTLYKNPALRIMADIDILIKNNEFKEIANALIALGYQSCIDKSSCQKELFEIPFLKKLSENLQLYIELHTEISPARPYRINLPQLWERAQETAFNGKKLVYLSAEDTFLSLALHLRRHTRRLTLKFVLDIAELLNSERERFDWEYIRKAAKDNHILTVIYLSLYLARELLNAKIPPKKLEEFRPNIIKCWFVHLTINKYNFFDFKRSGGTFLRILMFDSLKDFILYLWRVSLGGFIVRPHS